MRDYAELIKAMKCCSGRACCNACPYEKDEEKCDSIEEQAADAIEELIAMACPHYHRNVHDRGDDSYCDVLNTEPPKEKA